MAELAFTPHHLFDKPTVLRKLPGKVLVVLKGAANSKFVVGHNSKFVTLLT
jgi:hypothetical protein